MDVPDTSQTDLVVISWRKMAVLVTLVIGLAWFFVPAREEIVSRLVRDGNLERAATVAVETVGVDAQSVSLTAVESWHALKEQDGALTPDEVREMLIVLVATAVHEDQGDLAREIVRDEAAKLDAATDDEARRLVTALRQGAQTEAALEWLERRCQTAGHTLPADLAELRITILLELSRPSDALDVLLAALDHGTQADAVPDTATLVRATQAAEFCDRARDVRPLLERWAAASPFMRGSIEEFCASQPEKLPEADIFLCLAGKLARWHEWAAEPEAALPLYLRLARLHDSYALDRAAELYEPLCQPVEFLCVLDALAKSGDLPPPSQRERARLLGIVGRDMEAVGAFRDFLALHPADAAMWLDLSALCEDMGRNDDALHALRKAVNLAPADLVARKELAALAGELGHHSEALEVYRSLAPEQHDSITLESYALLAGSLANNEELDRALTLRLARLPAPLAADYLELARSHHFLGKQDARLVTLRDGLVRLPRERRLVRALAEGLIDTERPAEAADLIASEGTLAEPRQLALFIEASSRASRGRSALAVLEKNEHDALDTLPPDTRVHHARLHMQAGRPDAAAALLSAITATPAIFSLLAETRLDLGDLAAARDLQQRHLAAVGDSMPDSWLLLGDIERAAGDEDAARAAFERALVLIRDKASSGDITRNSTAKTEISIRRAPPKSLLR